MKKALCLVLPFATACAALPAAAAPGVNVGALTCDTSASIATIVMQRQDLRCVFAPADGPLQFYKGRLDAYGLAIGAVFRGKLAWGVLAPTPDAPPPGALAGSYSGLSAQASFGGGGGLNLLMSDTNNMLMLQPLSAEGHVGANVVGGVARMTLIPTRETRPRRVWDRWDD